MSIFFMSIMVLKHTELFFCCLQDKDYILKWHGRLFVCMALLQNSDDIKQWMWDLICLERTAERKGFAWLDQHLYRASQRWFLSASSWCQLPSEVLLTFLKFSEGYINLDLADSWNNKNITMSWLFQWYTVNNKVYGCDECAFMHNKEKATLAWIFKF